MPKVLLLNISELVTPIGRNLKKGVAMQQDIRVIKNAAMLMENGEITWVGPQKKLAPTKFKTAKILDAKNRAVIPGLVDPHTHAVWGGNRLNDFELRLAGANYEEILRNGGGIRSSIAQTTQASIKNLVDAALPRIHALVRSGATCIEIKSGYGYSFREEIKILEAIAMLKQKTPAHIEATLLIHVPPKNKKERKDYVSMVCKELIPNVAKQKLATATDVFCEQEAFGLKECKQILLAAKAHKLKTKLHADQFHAIGGTELAVRMNCLSVDHLEASGKKQISVLAKGNTVATVLPFVSLHLGLPFAPARKLIDAGAAVAIATDLNPGSAPIFSAQLVMALATRSYKFSLQEVLCASTSNAAHALGLGKKHGRLEKGCAANFLLLQENDWRSVVYAVGTNPIAEVFIGAKKVKP